MAVDLPAPFAPITATRDTRLACKSTSKIVGVSRVGYWNVTFESLTSALLKLLTPASGPGFGNSNFVTSFLSSK